MPRFDTLEDGSLLFEGEVVCHNTNYRVDPDNQQRLIPIFPECKRRVVVLRVLQCGLRRCNFNCNKFFKPVTIGDCNACQEAER